MPIMEELVNLLDELFPESYYELKTYYDRDHNLVEDLCLCDRRSSLNILCKIVQIVSKSKMECVCCSFEGLGTQTRDLVITISDSVIIPVGDILLDSCPIFYLDRFGERYDMEYIRELIKIFYKKKNLRD